MGAARSSRTGICLNRGPRGGAHGQGGGRWATGWLLPSPSALSCSGIARDHRILFLFFPAAFSCWIPAFLPPFLRGHLPLLVSATCSLVSLGWPSPISGIWICAWGFTPSPQPLDPRLASPQGSSQLMAAHATDDQLPHGWKDSQVPRGHGTGARTLLVLRWQSKWKQLVWSPARLAQFWSAPQP